MRPYFLARCVCRKHPMTTATPPRQSPINNFVEELFLHGALEWLCEAAGPQGVMTLNPPEGPAVVQCVKNAKRDIEKALLGQPQGTDSNGDELPPKDIVLVDRTTGWGLTRDLTAYTTAEEIDPNGGTLTQKSGKGVGTGQERVVISQRTLYNMPWLLSSVLGHEGKRLSQELTVVNALSPTKPEKKSKAEGAIKAYCTNIAILRNALRRLQNAVQNTTPGSRKQQFISKQIMGLALRIKKMDERKKEHQQIKEDNCG